MKAKKNYQKTLWIALFLAPSLAGLTIFMILPIISSLGLTFFEWDPLIPTHFTFIGISNYQRLVTDKNFWAALGHTLNFIIIYVPLVLVTGLGTALLLNKKLRGLAFFRGAFFMPVISAWVAVALLWMWIFNPKYGLLNYLLGLVGIQGPAWLFDPQWAMFAIILTSVWKDTGYVMVMYLSSLQNIPDEYGDAAAIDGANSWQKFLYITLPLLSPSTFFALVISLINSFQVFDQVWIMTGGGPAGATSVLMEQIVNNAFRYNRMGYAAALSWALFLLVFLVTVLQNQLQKKWVFYE